MVDLLYCPTDLLSFNISILYYYLSFRSLIIRCLFSGDIYLSLGISLLTAIYYVLFATVSELFLGELFETLVILSAIL